MRRRGTPFVGVVYCGLALTSKGPRVIEFNARFGDPEIQVVLARLRTPLAGILRSEEHTSELQSRGHLVCRLLLEKKKGRLVWEGVRLCSRNRCHDARSNRGVAQIY